MSGAERKPVTPSGTMSLTAVQTKEEFILGNRFLGKDQTDV